MLHQSKEVYGLKPASKVRLWWGAKASYSNFCIELVETKMQIVGGTAPEREAITQWVENVGLPAIKKLVEDERLGDEEERMVTHRDPKSRFLIVANPKGSYGYIYICATPYDPN